MADPKEDFLYYTLNDEGQSGTTDANGNVFFTSVPTPMDDTPEGWQENAIKWIRNPTLSGIFRSMTAPFSFKKQGAKILRWVFWFKFGYQASIRLHIQRRNNDNIYEDMYTGNMDGTKLSDVNGGVTVEIQEAGLLEMFTANRATTYEIPVDVPEAKNVVMDGIELFGSTTFLATNGTNTDPGNMYRAHVVALQIVADDADSFAFGAKDSDRMIIGGYDGPTIAATNQHFFTATTTASFTIKYKLYIQVYTPLVTMVTGQMFVGLSFLNGNVQVIPNTSIYTISGPINIYGANTGAVDPIKTHLIEGEVTVNLPAGVSVYLFTGLNQFGAQADSTRYDYFAGGDGFITVDYSSRFESTYCKMLRASYVFSWLVNKITNGKYTGTSDILLDKARDFVMTSGDALRDIEGAVIKTNLDDFITSYNVRFNIGIGQSTNGLRVEGKRHFYNNEVMNTLGAVNSSEYGWYVETLFNKIVIGWPDQTYDDVNGKNEFNTTNEFGTTITKVTKELTLLSVYRADGYGAEYVRRNLTGKKTTDSNSDNDIWIMNVAPDTFTGSVTFSNFSGNIITLFGNFASSFSNSIISIDGSANNDGSYNVISAAQLGGFTEFTVLEAVNNESSLNITVQSNSVALNRPAYVITGAQAPGSIFNVELSPMRCLIEHGNYLRSGLYGNESSLITFNTGKKNYQLSTTLNGVTISEKAPVLVGSLEGPLFIPVNVVFDTNVQRGFAKMLLDDPYAKIPYLDRGQEWTAYILEVGESPAFNPAQRFKMVLAPGNDISKLQNTYNG